MKVKNLSVCLILASLLCCGACKKPSSPEALSSKDPQTLAVKLKEGSRIEVKHIELDKDSSKLGKWIEREITLENPGGAEGMTVVWKELSGDKPGAETAPMAQGQVITIQEDGSIPDSLKDLVNPNGGQLNLPNLTTARRMTLPAFWPHGDLYLSDSSGIWLSDAAFAEIKQNGKTAWDAGLLNNPLLGPAENLEIFVRALAYFQDGLKDKTEKLTAGTSLKREGEKKIILEIDGKPQSVEALELGNWLARLTVLDNAQNPLVLAFQIAPEATPAELLFSPLGMLKGLLEFQVTGFRNPKPSQGSL